MMFNIAQTTTETTQLGFGIRTPPQCKSILVCENTKTESTYFHGKFPSK